MCVRISLLKLIADMIFTFSNSMRICNLCVEFPTEFYYCRLSYARNFVASANRIVFIHYVKPKIALRINS